jgi:ketosteroid isomerase-like protein
MKRLILSPARVAALALWLALAGNGTSYAQETDIKAAIDALHAAISTLDVSKIEPLWVHDNSVMSKQPPDKNISVGWDAVQDGLGSGFPTLIGTERHPGGRALYTSQWQCGMADGNRKAVGKLKTGAAVNALVAETDVFEKSDGKWLIVSHTATRLPQ